MEEIKSLKEAIKKTIVQIHKEEMEKLLGEIKSNRKRIEKLEKVKKGERPLEEFVRGLEDDVWKEFEKVRASLKESIEKNRELADRFETELKALKEGPVQAKATGPEIDIKALTRELESLKTKTGWLESTVEKLSALNEKTKELENEIKTMKALSPVIIE